jgi:PPOX class probable F420-dependent enzyme
MVDPLTRIAAERVGELATTRPDGAPHIVPVVFAVSRGRVVTPIDWKPKRTRRLQRLSNIEANPTVSFLVHHYSEDWSGLWWVRVDGTAILHQSGPAWDEAITALSAKYGQYRERPPVGEVISITPGKVASWSSRG